MSVKKLPEGAYAALEGLKAQAGAAMLMFPGESRESQAEGKRALAAAHARIAENEGWAKEIVKALMTGSEQVSIESADAEWLERTFAETST